MSELQSSKAYAIDDFRFAWKTRKLGQIITKYESITDLQIHKCSIEFAIENFLNYTSKQSTQFNQYQHLKSDKFSATEWEHLQFHLQVYPNGEDEQTKGILVIQVCSSANKGKKLIVQVQLSIIDQNGNKNLQKAEHQTLYKDNYLEWTDFVHHKMLFDNNCELLHNNSWIICCEIEIVLLPEARLVHTPAAIRIEPELCHLLTNQQPSDFVLKCGEHSEVQLHAHKSIFAHRSNVFASMLHYDTIEKRNSAVNIIDIEPDVLWALLQFIYTGQIENLEKFALELFVAAEKYNLIELKSICQEWLCANLTPQTVANILVTADMYCVFPMKHHTIAYFHQNAEEIIRYNSGKMIPNSIFIELYQDIIRIHRNCTKKSDEQNNIVQLIKMSKCDDDVREDRDVSVL